MATDGNNSGNSPRKRLPESGIKLQRTTSVTVDNRPNREATAYRPKTSFLESIASEENDLDTNSEVSDSNVPTRSVENEENSNSVDLRSPGGAIPRVRINDYRDTRTDSDASSHRYESGSSNQGLRRQIAEDKKGNMRLLGRGISVPEPLFDENREMIAQQRRVKTGVDSSMEMGFVSGGLFIENDEPIFKLKQCVAALKRNEMVTSNDIGGVVRECDMTNLVPFILEIAFLHPQLTTTCLAKTLDLVQTQNNYSHEELQDILKAWAKCKIGKENLTCRPRTWLLFLKLSTSMIENLIFTLVTSNKSFDDKYDILGKKSFIRDESNKLAKLNEETYSKDLQFFADFICGILDMLDEIVCKVRPLLGLINTHVGDSNIIKQGGFYKTFERLDIYSQTLIIKSMFLKVCYNPQFIEALRKCASVYDEKSMMEVFWVNKDKSKRSKVLQMFLHKTRLLVECVTKAGDPTQFLPLFQDITTWNQQDPYMNKFFLRVVTPLLFHANDRIRESIKIILSKVWPESSSWRHTSLVEAVGSKWMVFSGVFNEDNTDDERRCCLQFSGYLDECKKLMGKVEMENIENTDTHNKNFERTIYEKRILKALESEYVVKLMQDNMFDTLPPLLVIEVGNEYVNLAGYLRGHLKEDENVIIPLKERLAIVAQVMTIHEFCQKRHILLGAYTANNYVYSQKEKKAKLHDVTCAVRADSGTKYTGHKSDPLPLLVAAPESVLKARYSPCSEVFTLGHFMNEVLSHGIHSFEEWYPSTDVLTLVAQIFKYDWIPERRPGVPIAIFQLILQCLAMDIDKRINFTRLQKNVTAQLEILSKQTSKRKENAIQGIIYLRNLAKLEPRLHNAIRFPPQELLDINTLEALVSDSSLCRDYEKEYQDSVLLTSRMKSIQAVTAEEMDPKDNPVVMTNDEKKFREPILRHSYGGRAEQELRNYLLDLEHDNVAIITNFTRDKIRDIWLMEYTLRGSGSYTCLLDYYTEYNGSRSSRMPGIGHYLQIAQGMKFLHENGIVHGSLQAKYCYLFSADNQVKIGRLSRMCKLNFDKHEDTDMQAMVDIMTYPFEEMPVDIQRYVQDEVLSCFSDVAMFGYVMLQLENAGLCHGQEITPYCNFDIKMVKIFQKCRLKPYLSNQRPTDDNSKFVEDLIFQCIQIPAHNRPLFSTLVQKLESQCTGREFRPVVPLPPTPAEEDYMYTSTETSQYQGLVFE